MINMGWRRRHRRGRCGRLPKPVTIEKPLNIKSFSPNLESNLPPIHIEPAEVEALRLVDLEGLSQEEAGERMGVSRGTVWRLVQSARKKTAQAISEGRSIRMDTNHSSPPE